MIPTAYVWSPFGWFELTGTEYGLQSVRLREEMRTPPTADVPPVLAKAANQLTEYFDGDRRVFRLKLDWTDAPEFHKAVWEQLLAIPYGHTTSYKAIAERLGDVKSVRAVGQANRHNPLAIIVPCHRVIAQNGDLQGYFYGLNMKRALAGAGESGEFCGAGVAFLKTAHDGRLTMDGSRWTAHDGRLTMDGSRWTAHDGRLTMDGSRWTAHDGRLTMDGSRWTAHDGRFFCDS